MRRVDLGMKENECYETIKNLVENGGSKLRASIKLSCCMKTIDRMIAGYKKEGKIYFIHGNKGKQPANTIPEEIKHLIVKLYKEKYFNANFIHFTELLQEHENIHVSGTVVRKTLANENIISPKANRKTKRSMKKLLEEKLKNPKLSDEKVTEIIKTIIDIEDAHPRRPRSANFGELIQMDASVHIWFGDLKCHLHIAVDDCTGRIVGAYFDFEETLNGYYNVFSQILVNYGVPYRFLTDRRTVFEYNKKNNQPIEKDTFTQFSYACNQLGVDIQCTSVPQAKGRVERFFDTLQSRLPVELRLAGVTDISSANEFLNTYVKKFNAKFALPVDLNKSVFEDQPSLEKINLILAVISKRSIDNGHCIKYDKKFYKTVDSNNFPVYHRKGTEVLVIKAFDGGLYATINETVYVLDVVPERERFSKNFDMIKDDINPKNKYIPPISHPWKAASFNNHLKKQAHLKNKSA